MAVEKASVLVGQDEAEAKADTADFYKKIDPAIQFIDALEKDLIDIVEELFDVEIDGENDEPQLMKAQL